MLGKSKNNVSDVDSRTGSKLIPDNTRPIVRDEYEFAGPKYQENGGDGPVDEPEWQDTPAMTNEYRVNLERLEQALRDKVTDIALRVKDLTYGDMILLAYEINNGPHPDPGKFEVTGSGAETEALAAKLHAWAMKRTTKSKAGG